MGIILLLAAGAAVFAHVRNRRSQQQGSTPAKPAGEQLSWCMERVYENTNTYISKVRSRINNGDNVFEIFTMVVQDFAALLMTLGGLTVQGCKYLAVAIPNMIQGSRGGGS